MFLLGLLHAGSIRINAVDYYVCRPTTSHSNPKYILSLDVHRSGEKENMSTESFCAFVRVGYTPRNGNRQAVQPNNMPERGTLIIRTPPLSISIVV